MYRVFIDDDWRVSNYTYPIFTISYKEFELIPDEYNDLCCGKWISSLCDSFGEGEQYQLAVF